MESGLQTAGSRHRAECSGRKVKHIGSQRSMNYIYRDRGTNWISDGQIYRGEKYNLCRTGRAAPGCPHRWSSPSDGPLGPVPAAGRPWRELSGPRSPSAWRWERRSPSSPPSPCWSGCRTAAATHTHKREERMHIYVYEQRPRTERVPNDSICLFSSWHCLEFTGSNACMCRTEFARQKPTLAYIACHFLLCVSRVRT